MSNEKLIARGMLEELKEKRFALITEIRTLADDIRRMVPTPPADSKDISLIKSKEAMVLLKRLILLQDKY